MYASAVAELRVGRKIGHWRFALPQIAGLGASSTSRRYGITTLNEARRYLEPHGSWENGSESARAFSLS